MKKINELIEPSLDAIDYRDKQKKKFFVQSYVATEFLEKGCKSNCYYFVGEKGTGKTALAFHIQNSSPDNIGAKLISISETQYSRFIKLKEAGKLEYTDYAMIWRATILYQMAKLAIEKKKKWHHKSLGLGLGKFSKIESAMTKYDKESQIPELEFVIEVLSALTSGADMSASISEAVKFGVKASSTDSTKTTAKDIKAALLECEGVLKGGLNDLNFNGDIALFIDGLDAKPNDVDFEEYHKCLVGLSEAVWYLNSEFFATIKDTRGRMRSVLLLRPDVFDSLNMHNSNCKLLDNSVVFHWHTTNDRHLTSELYKVSDRYFLAQNEGTVGWNSYFQEVPSTASVTFMNIIKASFQRPRDFFAALKILISISKRSGCGADTSFARNVLATPEFRDAYSDYLLGEVKNYANYYITNAEFDAFSSFFQYLNGANKFDSAEFQRAFDLFKKSLRGNKLWSNSLLSSSEVFLQFWYDVNVIGYSETSEDGQEHFYRWSLRERTPSKVMPKVKLNGQYLIHSGIAKALNIGRRLTASA